MARLKCPAFGCGSTNVQMIGGKTKTSLNLNPLHPFTLVSTKAKGKQKFQCLVCGKVWEQKI